jgi:hypothetical protein
VIDAMTRDTRPAFDSAVFIFSDADSVLLSQRTVSIQRCLSGIHSHNKDIFGTI